VCDSVSAPPSPSPTVGWRPCHMHRHNFSHMSVLTPRDLSCTSTSYEISNRDAPGRTIRDFILITRSTGRCVVVRFTRWWVMAIHI
jgi:hypothetical protein